MTLTLQIGTLSHYGYTPRDIAELLQLKVTRVRALLWIYKHPKERNKRANDYYHKNKERLNKYAKDWRKAHPESVRETNYKKKLKLCGISDQ